MKKTMILFIMIFISITVFSQDSVIRSGTALTVPRGRLEFGLTNPLTYGLGDTISLTSHPLLDILLPNLAVKSNWLQSGSLYVSTEHSLNYPTLLLSLLTGRGTGAILAEDNDIPQVFVIGNQVLLSYVLGSQIISLRGGAKWALKIPDNDFETIDYPFIYYNTVVYRTGFTFNIEAGYRLNFAGQFWLLVDAGIILLPEPVGETAIPHEIRQSANLLFKLNDWFSANAGYLLVAGEYPYGNDWKIFPTLDAIFSFGGR